MNNKKLIKELMCADSEMVIMGDRGKCVKLKGFPMFDLLGYYLEEDAFYVYKYENMPTSKAEMIKKPTFEKIAALVKELTGVILINKKQTKRQEIYTLRAEVKRQETDYDKLFDLYDALKRDITIVRSCGNDNLLKIKRQHKRIDALEQGNQSQAQMIEDLQKSYAEPKSEPEKTEGVFKVGDPVVIVHNPKNGLDANYINSAILNKTQHIITSEDARSNHLGTKINDAVYWFTPNDLQHAPKEAEKVLEFDKWAAIKTGDYRLNEGTKVLLIQELEISGGKLWWRCYTDKDRGSINILAEDLKAL
jgi:hypothetical protein